MGILCLLPDSRDQILGEMGLFFLFCSGMLVLVTRTAILILVRQHFIILNNKVFCKYKISTYNNVFSHRMILKRGTMYSEFEVRVRTWSLSYLLVVHVATTSLDKKIPAPVFPQKLVLWLSLLACSFLHTNLSLMRSDLKEVSICHQSFLQSKFLLFMFKKFSRRSFH